MPNVLVFSRDPGPTNLLIALVERLCSPALSGEEADLTLLRRTIGLRREMLRIVAREPGLGMWQAAGFSPEPWPANTDAGALLAVTGARHVLTGSSDVDEFGDRDLWQAARTQGIESHVVLDHPANLSARFNDRAGLPLRPDWIYVADYDFRQRLIDSGHAKSLIRVISDLHHDRLRSIAASWTNERIAQLRKSFGAAPNDMIVLFASECVREMERFGYSAPFDEFEVLNELVAALARGELPDGERIDADRVVLVIRPHPRDHRGKYDKFGDISALRVQVRADVAPEGAILAADLVVGMTSSLLFEAVQLGRRVVSLTGHNINDGKSRVRL
jgi:hypothetical protein